MQVKLILACRPVHARFRESKTPQNKEQFRIYTMQNHRDARAHSRMSNFCPIEFAAIEISDQISNIWKFSDVSDQNWTNHPMSSNILAVSMSVTKHDQWCSTIDRSSVLQCYRMSQNTSCTPNPNIGEIVLDRTSADLRWIYLCGGGRNYPFSRPEIYVTLLVSRTLFFTYSIFSATSKGSALDISIACDNGEPSSKWDAYREEFIGGNRPRHRIVR